MAGPTVPRAAGSLAAYGIPDSGPGGTGKGSRSQPQHPVTTIEECLRAAQQALKETKLSVQQVPWHKPPYRARTEPTLVRAVINIDAAVDAAANAAGLLLVTAQQTYKNLDLSGATAGATLPQWFDLWSAVPNDSEAIVIQSWGITCVNLPPEALNVRISGHADGGKPTPPNPRLSSYQADQLQQVNAIVAPNKPLTVQISPVLNTAALLVYFSVSYYRFPVTKYQDGEKGLNLETGFGVCK